MRVGTSKESRLAMGADRVLRYSKCGRRHGETMLVTQCDGALSSRKSADGLDCPNVS
jgi:hypothetical protein